MALQYGFDLRPFVVAVTIGTRANVAKLIWYQTNTLVYSAAGQKFLDFVTVGVLVNVIIGALSVLVIPLIWPLAG